MPFATPLALLGLLFVPAVIAMYLLKLRRDEAVVPSTLLWTRLVADVEANAPWQRLRRSLLFFLQLLLVIALALLAVIFIVRGVPGAFAEQLFPWATGGLTVLCPIIAAALFVLAGLYGWSRRLTDRYRALEQAERDVRELREYCERGLTEPAPATPTAGPTTTPAVAIGGSSTARS